MAAKKTAEPEEAAPAGPAPQTYHSTVLVVVPRQNYGEQTMRYVRSCLANVHVATRTVASVDYELIKGRLQDEFLADGKLARESMDDYSGVIFVAGEGVRELANDPDAQRLAREAAQAGKLIGAWGESVAVLTRAGVVKGKKLTGKRTLADEIENSGGRYTGVQVQVDGFLVTGLDDAAGLRFGRALAQVVGI